MLTWITALLLKTINHNSVLPALQKALKLIEQFNGYFQRDSARRL